MSASPPPPRVPAGGPLLGREAEIRAIADRVGRVADGTGAVVLIEGEAGIGKTGLLQVVLTEVVPAGCLVLRGAAGELEADRPFGAFAQALEIHRRSADPERAGIARLLLGETREPGGDLPPFAEVRHRLVEEIVSLVERLGLQRPVVLALEDLHWADPSTVLVVDHIGRRLTHLPIALLATFRPAPRQAMLHRVVGDLVAAGGLKVEVGPLDAGSVAGLVERIAKAPPTPHLLSLAASASGNPLFVIHLVGALQAEGALSIIDGRAGTDVQDLPPSFRELVLRQLADIPDQTLHVLRVAAVLGTTFSLIDLATVLGRRPTDLLDDLDVAHRSKILDAVDAGLSFRHELVREAVYQDVPAAIRRGLHLQAGQALATAGAPAVQVAPHLARGASVGDSAAAAWLARAAREVGSRAPGTAVELFEHAVRIIGADDSARYAITVDLVDAFIWSGRYPDAVAQAHDLLTHERDQRRRHAVRLSLTRAMLIAGRTADAKVEVEAALRDFTGDESDRLRLDADAAWVRIFSGDAASGRVAAQDVVDRATHSGDDDVRQHAYGAVCLSAFQSGDATAAIEAGTRALELGGPGASVAHRYGSHIFLGTALMEADRVDEADGVFRAGHRIAEGVGMSWQPSYYHAQLGLLAFDTGRWDDALADLEASSLTACERADGVSAFAEAIRAVIALHRDALTVTRRHLAEAERAVAEGRSLGTDVVMWVSAKLLAAGGDRRTALTTLEHAWRLNLAIGFRSQNGRLALDFVQLALAENRADLASEVAAEMEALAALNPCPTRHGAALLCRGLLDVDTDLLLAAMRAYDDSPRRPERAWAALAAGAALARAGHREEAITLLTGSAAACEDFGAAHDVAQADRALRDLGVRRGRRGRRGRPQTGWNSLTRTELEIVRLAVDGLTNAGIGRRMFISGRTVETHFSHIFAKLGVSSRVQVAAEAVRRLPTNG